MTWDDDSDELSAADDFRELEPFEEAACEANIDRENLSEPEETWRPIDPDKRGFHKSFGAAVDAAFADLTVGHNPFFDSLCDNWQRLFPSLPAKPGRFEDGKIFIYVRTSSALFMLRPRLKKIAAQLAQLPNAPKRIDLRLEIHAT